MTDSTSPRVRGRREPPPLQPVTVVASRELSPRLLRLTFEGVGLGRMGAAEPAASVRLLVPSPGSVELVIPDWDGNEFLLPDRSRPTLRTFTPLRIQVDAGRLDLEIVRHPGGAISKWAESVVPGAPAAISGPGKGWTMDDDVGRVVLLGDETALPAITQLLDVLPDTATVDVHVEVVTDEAILPVQGRDGAELSWHVRPAGGVPGASLVEVAERITDVDSSTRVWAAGEAASMQAIRRHLFNELGVPRSRTSIRGYWKPARPT